MPQRAPRTVRLAGVAMVIIAALACASPEQRFAEHVASAETLVEAGEPDKAILEYRSALKIDGDDVEINLRLADLLLESGDEDALYYYGEAYRLDPERLDVGARLGRLLLMRGQTRRATEIIVGGLERAPDAAALHSAKAELSLFQNDVDAALAAARKAVELEPEEAPHWMQLGRVHKGAIRQAQLKKERPAPVSFVEGMAAFGRADELAGGSVPAQIERARLVGLRGGSKRKDEAELAFRNAMALAVDQGEPALQLMVANATLEFARQTKRTNLQRWALNQIVEVDPKRMDAWNRLVELVDGQYRLGGLVFPRLLEKSPDDVRAHLMFTNYLVQRDRAGQAIQHIQKEIGRGLEAAMLWEQLMRIQIHQRQLANARATFVRMSEAFPDDPITTRAEARLALAENRPADAAKLLRGLAGKVQNTETQRMLAITELQLGNLPNASAAIDRAASLSKGFNADVIRLKVRIHQEAGEWLLALRALALLDQHRVALRPDEKLIRVRALYETGKERYGKTELRQLLRSPGAPPAAAVEFAKREGRADSERARTHLLAALGRAPENHDVLEALTRIDLREGRGSEAVERLNQLVQSRRATPTVLLLRARALAQLGALERAEADALRAFEAAPDLGGAVQLLFSIYKAQDRLDEARRSFEEAEAAGVLHSGARLLLGHIYLAQGDSAKALAMLERVVEDAPDLPGAKNDLAFLLADEGQDLDRALRLAEEAQQALSSDQRTADTVGYVYYRKGLHEAALQQFRYAIELAGESPGEVPGTLHYHLGLTLQALGREEQAAQAFEQALAAESDFPKADDARRQLRATRKGA